MQIKLIKNVTTKNKHKSGAVTKTVDSLGFDITALVSDFTWSESDEQVSRVFEFSMLNALYDEKMKACIPSVDLGDLIVWSEDNKIMFYGMVMEKEALSATGTESYTARDFLYYMVQSKWNNTFKKKTPESIAVECAKEVGLQTGELAKTNIKIKKYIASNEFLYDTLKNAYTTAGLDTMWQYKIDVVDGTKLTVHRKGAVVDAISLSDNTNIYSVSLKESVSELVNRVKAYNKGGKLKGTVEDEKSIDRYGIFQTAYSIEKGGKWKNEAEAELKGPTQEIEIEGKGVLSCVSGYAVSVNDSATGLNAVYWIISDSHSFQDGVHTMTLTLSFESITS